MNQLKGTQVAATHPYARKLLTIRLRQQVKAKRPEAWPGIYTALKTVPEITPKCEELMSGFVWQHTEQGFDYWNDIAKEFQA